MMNPSHNYVFCVLWEGNFRQRDYSPKDVLFLKKQLELNVSSDVDYEFVCLTNKYHDELCGIEQIPLVHNLPGWWSKLELFRKFLPFREGSNCLYIDLDVLITGDITPLLLNELQKNPEVVTFAPPASMTTTSIQSSVIHWKMHYFNLDLDVMDTGKLQQKYRGDQDFFNDTMKKKAATFPEKWFCKLRDCWDAGPKKPVKVVLGNPKPLWWKREEKEWICKLMCA